jgi:hypothetical protein
MIIVTSHKSIVLKNAKDTQGARYPTVTGYLHPNYAESLSEFGQPIALPKSEGWLLQRPIPHSEDSDAMGCYPMFACVAWQHVAEDIEKLRERLVTVALVADPFGNHDEKLLRQTFERVVAFKSHFIVGLGSDPEEIASKHHRYYARKALTKVSVEVVSNLDSVFPGWCGLYNNLIQRHNLSGIKAFSPMAFERQFRLDGLVVLQAVYENRLVGAHLWMVQGEVANSHLAAFSNEGYELMCAYALYWEAIRHFTGKVKWLNIGAGAGFQTDAQDGLTRFKRGWSTGSRTAWFCASVLQPEKYAILCAQPGASGSSYFPAYRRGTF